MADWEEVACGDQRRCLAAVLALGIYTLNGTMHSER